MRLRTVNSIILPSAHKVKASARNSVTTVVGGGREMLRGTLERVPRTPQNFSQILYWRGWGGGAERGLAPGGGRAPARHLFALPLWCPVGGLPPRGTCYPCPGGEDHLKRRRRLRRIVPSPPVPPLLGCRHCSRESLSVGFTPYRRLPRRKENCMAGFISAASGSVQGCRGRSPRRNKL